MDRRRVLALVGATAATSLAGCTGLFEDASSSYENGVQINCIGDVYPDRIEFDCGRFDGAVGRIVPVEAGTTIAATARSNLESGSVRFLVRDPDDEVRWEAGYDDTDPHETRSIVAADQQGRYHLRVEGDDAEGSFLLEWTLDG